MVPCFWTRASCFCRRRRRTARRYWSPLLPALTTLSIAGVAAVGVAGVAIEAHPKFNRRLGPFRKPIATKANAERWSTIYLSVVHVWQSAPEFLRPSGSVLGTPTTKTRRLPPNAWHDSMTLRPLAMPKYFAAASHNIASVPISGSFRHAGTLPCLASTHCGDESAKRPYSSHNGNIRM